MSEVIETSENKKIQIIKSTNAELKQATFLVLSPEEVDLHGDIYSAEEVRKACHNFNQNCMTANLMHMVETNSFEIVESYISPVDMILGEKLIKAGSWMSVIQVNSDSVWADIKDGSLTGVSIGAFAETQYLEDDNE